MYKSRTSDSEVINEEAVSKSVYIHLDGIGARGTLRATQTLQCMRVPSGEPCRGLGGRLEGPVWATSLYFDL